MNNLVFFSFAPANISKNMDLWPNTDTHTHTHIDSMHNGCHGHDLLFSLLRLHCRSLTLRSSDWHAFGWLSSHTYTLDPPPHILTHTHRSTALHVRALCLIPSQLWLSVCVSTSEGRLRRPWRWTRKGGGRRVDGGRERGRYTFPFWFWNTSMLLSAAVTRTVFESVCVWNTNWFWHMNMAKKKHSLTQTHISLKD